MYCSARPQTGQLFGRSGSDGDCRRRFNAIRTCSTKAACSTGTGPLSVPRCAEVGISGQTPSHSRAQVPSFGIAPRSRLIQPEAPAMLGAAVNLHVLRCAARVPASYRDVFERRDVLQGLAAGRANEGECEVGGDRPWLRVEDVAAIVTAITDHASRVGQRSDVEGITGRTARGPELIRHNTLTRSWVDPGGKPAPFREYVANFEGKHVRYARLQEKTVAPGAAGILPG